MSFVSELRPPLVFETILETTFGLARAGKTTKQGIPKAPLQLAVLVDETRGMFYSSRVPVAVQEAFVTLFGVLASVGRLLGYKARYPEYSGPEPAGEEATRPHSGTGGRMEAVVAALFIVALALFLLSRWQRRRLSGR